MGIEDLNYRLRPSAENALHQPKVIEKQPNKKSAAKKAWWENKRRAEAQAEVVNPSADQIKK